MAEKQEKPSEYGDNPAEIRKGFLPNLSQPARYGGENFAFMILYFRQIYALDTQPSTAV
jgi:hypothetical protein